MRPSLPIAAAAATGILVGAAIVVTRFVIAQTEPASLAFLRYVLGCVFLLPAWLMGEKRPSSSVLFVPPCAVCCIGRIGFWLVSTIGARVNGC